MLRLIACAAVGLLLTACAGPRIDFRYLDRYPTGHVHPGLDLGTYAGEPIRAIADGHVVSAVSTIDPPVWPIVYIQHDGFGARYYHIDRLTVKNGDRVRQGQIIAHSALTGERGPGDPRPITIPHLHLEIYSDARGRQDPEKLGMQCPTEKQPQVRYLWPVGCNYKLLQK